jgi:hypothetical protein
MFHKAILAPAPAMGQKVDNFFHRLSTLLG